MELIVKDMRPFMRWARKAVKRGIRGKQELARIARKIGQIVELTMQQERYRQTHTSDQANVEFKRRQEILEDWAATYSGDMRWTLDRALDCCGHWLPFLMQGQIIEPQAHRTMWRPVLEDEFGTEKPVGAAPTATDNDLVRMGDAR